MHANLLDPSLLNGVYIPNLVASPFTVHKAYAELIYNRALSPRLSEVLRKWDEERWDAPKQRQKLAWVLLVELLSYQFSSFVRWIETQDLFFEQYKFECVEIGPSPTHRYGCPHP
jgi:fatty acid synthase subunit alpha, fungi type